MYILARAFHIKYYLIVCFLKKAGSVNKPRTDGVHVMIYRNI